MADPQTPNAQAQGSAQTPSPSSAQSTQLDIDPKWMYILAYLIPIFAGVVIFLIYGEKDKGIKFHALQSIAYGLIIYIFYYIIAILLMFNYLLLAIPNLIMLILWLYGLYIGYMAYLGKETPIPFLTDFLKKNLKI